MTEGDTKGGWLSFYIVAGALLLGIVSLVRLEPELLVVAPAVAVAYIGYYLVEKTVVTVVHSPSSGRLLFSAVVAIASAVSLVVMSTIWTPPFRQLFAVPFFGMSFAYYGIARSVNPPELDG